MKAPVKLTPAYKDYLWGGNELKTSFNKHTDLDTVAESWELSVHPDGQSRIAQGPEADKTLEQYIQEDHSILGTKVPENSDLPIMIKFIDARDNLSIQVHPEDDYARKYENDNGKTEMWIVLEARPDAFLYMGVKEDITREEAEQRIADGTFEEVLNPVHVEAGDVLLIPAGTIHAIGKGIVICEIQQSSNVTYRLYDYNRRDAQGNLRPLHIKKGLEVAKLQHQVVDKEPENVLISENGVRLSLLKSSKYFNTFEYDLDNARAAFHTTTGSFVALIVTEGNVSLKCETGTYDLKKGDTYFLPAQDASYSLFGSGKFVYVTI